MSKKHDLVWHGSKVRFFITRGTWRVPASLYWKLADSIPGKAAPVYLHIEGYGKEATIRLPIEIARQVRDVLDPAPGGWEVV